MPQDEILRLIVELEPQSGPIAGTIADGNSRAHHFDGMLDLMSAIESLRGINSLGHDPAGGDVNPDPPR